MGYFWSVYDTGVVLCQIALWNCFGGTNFWPSFPRSSQRKERRRSQKYPIVHWDTPPPGLTRNFKMALPGP